MIIYVSLKSCDTCQLELMTPNFQTLMLLSTLLSPVEFKVWNQVELQLYIYLCMCHAAPKSLLLLFYILKLLLFYVSGVQRCHVMPIVPFLKIPHMHIPIQAADFHGRSQTSSSPTKNTTLMS